MALENVVGVTSVVFMSARMALSSAMPNSKNYQKTIKVLYPIVQHAFNLGEKFIIIDKGTKASYSKPISRIGVGSSPGTSNKRRDNIGSS